MRFRIGAGAPLAILLLAGCTPQPDKFAARAATGGPPLPATALVQAFSAICGRFEETEVLRRAAGYGFVPMPAERLGTVLTEAQRTRNLKVLVRPVQNAPAMLFWADHPQSCELGAGGIDPAQAEQAFNAMVTRLQADPNLAVSIISQPPDAREPLRIRQMILLAPRALVPAPPRTIVFRSNDDATQVIRVSLTATAVQPQQAATPPPSAWGPLKQ